MTNSLRLARSTPDDKLREFTNNKSNASPRLKKMIWKFSRELLCILALILTTIASLQSRHSKYSVPVVPIFPNHIDEWPSGALTPVQNKIAANELSLVFFYAPYDGETTTTARTTFQEVAKFYSRDVYFAAVNCWRPTGECRAQYPKVSRWPIVVAYFPNGIALQYKGDWNFHALSLFIERLMRPLERITTSQELFNQKMSNDFVVLGLFEKPDESYQMYYQATIKSLELNRNIGFAVFIGNSSNNELGNLNLTQKWPTIKIFNRFSSMEYSQITWNTDNLIQWISNETRRQQMWYHISSEKSFGISNHLKSGQHIILFTPKTILKENNVEYLAFKQAFYAYKNCNNNPSLNLIIKNIPIIQNENINHLNYLETSCEINNEFINRWLSPENSNDFSCSVKPGKIFESNSSIYTAEKECDCQTVFREQIDKRSPEHILQKQHVKQCKFFFETKKYIKSWKPQQSEILSTNKQNYCQSNMTLSFHIIDSLENFDFIQRIISNESGIESKVLIIDSENEKAFVLSKDHSFSNLLEFINDFYSRSLLRLQRVTSVDDKQKLPFISFEELNTISLEKVTTREDENSVVLFYSPECALCNVMAQFMLQIQGVLKDMSNIKFYRIDSENNDLNWEYTMETYPTILFLPKNKTVEARAFSSTMRIDFKNLFGFILANLSSEDRILAVVLKCRSIKVNLPFMNCMKHLKNTISEEIAFQSQKYSIAHEKFRIEILEKLLILRNIYNNLRSDTCDFNIIMKDVYKLI